MAHRTAGEDRFRALAQAVSDLVVAVGPDRELVYARPLVEALGDHALGSNVLAGLPDLVAAEDQPALVAALLDVRSRAGSSRALILRLRHRDGGWRTVEVLLTTLLEDPVARAVVLTARDVTDQTALEEQLRHQARHDPLTRLAKGLCSATAWSTLSPAVSAPGSRSPCSPWTSTTSRTSTTASETDRGITCWSRSPGGSSGACAPPTPVSDS